MNILKNVYSDHNWDEHKFVQRGQKSAQRKLCVIVQDLFPQAVVYEDYNHPKLKFHSGGAAELDVYIPQLKLAFEYQVQV